METRGNKNCSNIRLKVRCEEGDQNPTRIPTIACTPVSGSRQHTLKAAIVFTWVSAALSFASRA